jgi:hypothetical protein
MEHLNKTEKVLLQDIQQKEDKGAIEQADLEEQETNNGIF